MIKQDIQYPARLVNFNRRDNKGREVGVIIYTGVTIFEEAAADAKTRYDIKPGEYYSLRFWAARDGQPYGVVQPVQYFLTQQEGQSKIDKYLKKRMA